MPQSLLTTILRIAGIITGSLPLVLATSVFGAIVVSACVKFFVQSPWYANTSAGALGGLLGLTLGMYFVRHFITLPQKYMSNFEYNRLYARHRVYLFLLRTVAVFGGGVIGLVVGIFV